MSENPYAPPRAEVADQALPQDAKPSAGVRFLWAAGTCFAIFVVLILLMGQRGVWVLALLGGGMFSVLSGLIALCIPVKNKAGFIIPSVALSLLICYFVGRGAS